MKKTVKKKDVKAKKYTKTKKKDNTKLSQIKLSPNTPMLVILTAIIVFIGIVAVVIISTSEKPVRIVCNEQSIVCPDGSTVKRVPPECKFEECPYYGDLVICPEDTITCPDRSILRRIPPSCEFEECPPFEPIPTPTTCPEDAKVCPDGSTVGRVLPDCQFEECPPYEEPDVDIESCGIWIGNERKAECYTVLAQEADDMTICENIILINFKEECYRAFALINDHPSACIYANPKDEKNCFRSSILRVDDYRKCLDIPKDTDLRRKTRDNCIINAIEKNPEIEGCSEVRTRVNQIKCYTQAAQALDTVEACQVIIDTGLWDHSKWGQANYTAGCFVDVVAKTRDIGVCNSLENDYDRWYCIRLGVQAIRLSSSQCTGLNQDDEYFCRAQADNDISLCDQIENTTERFFCKTFWNYGTYCINTDLTERYEHRAKGFAYNNTGFFEDTCLDEETVIEGSCGGTGYYDVITREIECPLSCKDGYCV